MSGSVFKTDGLLREQRSVGSIPMSYRIDSGRPARCADYGPGAGVPQSSSGVTLRPMNGKAKAKRRTKSKLDSRAFIGAKREGTKLVVFKEVTSRKGTHSKATITRRTVKAVKARKNGDWLAQTSLVSSLLPAFRSAVKDATAKAAPKPNR